MIMNIQQTDFPKYSGYPIAYESMTTGDNGTVPGSTQECVGLRGNDVHGAGRGNIGIKETKIKYENFNGVRACWSGRLYAYDYMGKVFLGSTRLHCE